MPFPAHVRGLSRKAHRVFCADGGAGHAARLGIEPRLVIGDMDSLPKPLPKWRNTVFLCDFSKEKSDFEKVLDLAASSGAREVWVAGAVGGRLDHLLVNLSLVERFAPGEASRTVYVPLTNDSTREPAKSFTVLLGRGGGEIVARTQVNIADDD